MTFAARAQEQHADFANHWNEFRIEAWSHDGDAITERDHKLVAKTAKIATMAKRHEATSFVAD